MLIVRSDKWHRYKPTESMGWNESYIGFYGDIASRLLEEKQVLKGKSVVYCGIHEEIFDTYERIISTLKTEKPGFQHIISGYIIKLIGDIVSFQKQVKFIGKPIEKKIEEAKAYIIENAHQQIDVKELSEELNLGYSYFRQSFKSHTGFSPHQYYLNEKINKARQLIVSTDFSMKEIAYQLNFESIFYFSKLFKQKTGLNPTDLRQHK